jgi:hypothetical protein
MVRSSIEWIDNRPQNIDALDAMVPMFLWALTGPGGCAVKFRCRSLALAPVTSALPLPLRRRSRCRR